jgi:conjugative transfer signal peptidase TraF
MAASPCNPRPLGPGGITPGWRHLARTLIAAAVLTIIAGAGCRALASRLTINVTASMPRGLYLLRPPGGSLRRGDAVYLAVPVSIRPLVAARRYLPPNFRLLKRVVALPGDHVCTHDERYVVGNQVLSIIASHDQAGRPLDAFSFCAIVQSGTAFVAAHGESSLDSRYFGPVSLNDLTRAVPLWTSF